MQLGGAHLFHSVDLLSLEHTHIDIDLAIWILENTIVRMRDEGNFG